MSEQRDCPADEKHSRVRRYLIERVGEGERYFKSRFIAEEVGLSAKEVGALLAELHRPLEGLQIEKWGYSGATTWRVAREERPDS